MNFEAWLGKIIENTVNDVKSLEYETDEELGIQTLETFHKNLKYACSSTQSTESDQFNSV